MIGTFQIGAIRVTDPDVTWDFAGFGKDGSIQIDAVIEGIEGTTLFIGQGSAEDRSDEAIQLFLEGYIRANFEV